MKVPKTFVPEKDLNRKVAEYNSDKRSNKSSKIKDLKNLVLRQDSEDFIGWSKMHDYVLKSYNLLNPKLVEEKVIVDYERLYVHIIKFLDKESLEFNLKGITATVNSYNQSTLARCNALFEDEYLIFIYFNLLDKKKSLKFVEAYKDLGFKKIKE